MPRRRSLTVFGTNGPVHAAVLVVEQQQLEAADLSCLHSCTHRQSPPQRMVSMSCHAAKLVTPVAQDHRDASTYLSSRPRRSGCRRRGSPSAASPKYEAVRNTKLRPVHFNHPSAVYKGVATRRTHEAPLLSRVPMPLSHRSPPPPPISPLLQLATNNKMVPLCIGLS